jgi:hypothetical protein
MADVKKRHLTGGLQLAVNVLRQFLPMVPSGIIPHLIERLLETISDPPETSPKPFRSSELFLSTGEVGFVQ